MTAIRPSPVYQESWMPDAYRKLYSDSALLIVQWIGFDLVGNSDIALKMEMRRDSRSVAAGMAAIGFLRRAGNGLGADIERPAAGLGQPRALGRRFGHSPVHLREIDSLRAGIGKTPVSVRAVAAIAGHRIVGGENTLSVELVDRGPGQRLVIFAAPLHRIEFAIELLVILDHDGFPDDLGKLGGRWQWFCRGGMECPALLRRKAGMNLDHRMVSDDAQRTLLGRNVEIGDRDFAAIVFRADQAERIGFITAGEISQEMVKWEGLRRTLAYALTAGLDSLRRSLGSGDCRADTATQSQRNRGVAEFSMGIEHHGRYCTPQLI